MQIQSQRPHRIYMTPQVVQMVADALEKPVDSRTIYNLSRHGKILERAWINNGVFDAFHVDKALRKMRRWKLATRLGRISPRYEGLEPEMEVECSQCDAFAVKWEDKWLCENGHTGSLS